MAVTQQSITVGLEAVVRLVAENNGYPGDIVWERIRENHLEEIANNNYGVQSVDALIRHVGKDWEVVAALRGPEIK